MEPFPGVPDAGCQQGLDIHVDVFVVGGKFHLSRLDIRQDVLEAADNGRRVLHGNDALRSQHFGMGHRASDILAVQPLVKANGGVQCIDKGIGIFPEPSGPQFHRLAPYHL